MAVKDGEGNFVPNRNFQTLLEEFGIRGSGGDFRLSPIVVPTMPVVSAEEEASSNIIWATNSAVVTNEGDQVGVTVPAAEIWDIHFISWHQGTVGAIAWNQPFYSFAGAFPLGVGPSVPEAGTTKESGDTKAFSTALRLVGNDEVYVERVATNAQVQTCKIAVGYVLIS